MHALEVGYMYMYKCVVQRSNFPLHNKNNHDDRSLP